MAVCLSDVSVTFVVVFVVSIIGFVIKKSVKSEYVVNVIGDARVADTRPNIRALECSGAGCFAAPH